MRLPTLKPLVPALPRARSSDAERRIRGTTLQNIRRIHLAERPLCQACLRKTPPRTSVATQLDHIVPLHLGGIDSRDPFENREGLCDDCHAEKSAREEQTRRGVR